MRSPVYVVYYTYQGEEPDINCAPRACRTTCFDRAYRICCDVDGYMYKFLVTDKKVYHSSKFMIGPEDKDE